MNQGHRCGLSLQATVTGLVHIDPVDGRSKFSCYHNHFDIIRLRLSSGTGLVACSLLEFLTKDPDVLREPVGRLTILMGTGRSALKEREEGAMTPWTWCGPGMGWMWMFPLLFFLLMIAMMGFFWRRGFRLPWCGMMGDHSHETPRQILDRRFASGEVTKEQYDEIRRSLA